MDAFPASQIRRQNPPGAGRSGFCRRGSQTEDFLLHCIQKALSSVRRSFSPFPLVSTRLVSLTDARSAPNTRQQSDREQPWQLIFQVRFSISTTSSAIPSGSIPACCLPQRRCSASCSARCAVGMVYSTISNPTRSKTFCCMTPIRSASMQCVKSPASSSKRSNIPIHRYGARVSMP